MIYIRMLFCLMALFFNAQTQAAAGPEMDKIVADENPPAFQDFFIMGRTANTAPNVDLVLWKATDDPSPQIDIYIVSGHPNFITHLKETAQTDKVEQDKVEQDKEQKRSAIQKLIITAGRQYTSGATKKVYAKRVTNIQNITRTTGSAEWNDENMEEGIFLSCPEKADIAVKMMAKFPVNGDKGDFSIEHFETLLKEDGYQGPYVIVQKDKSRQFLQALKAIVRTGEKYSTEWNAIEIPQKSYFQQAREFFLD